MRRESKKQRWKSGDWVLCGDPIGLYTLSACVDNLSDCNAGEGRTHAWPGLLRKLLHERWDSAVGQRLNIDAHSIRLDACMKLPKRKLQGVVRGRRDRTSAV